MSLSNIIQISANLIKNADKILITAGAGMGTDSGMPDYRGNKGFWTAHPEFMNKLSFHQVASPSYLYSDPGRFWAFYSYRQNIYAKTAPHEGHSILRRIVNRTHVKNYFVVTSNVDEHFLKMGFPEEQILEIHGNIMWTQCLECNKLARASIVPNDGTKKELSVDELPKCSCPKKSLLRPNVLMFGDGEWNSSRTDIQEEFYQDFLDSEYESKVILEFGAGVAVPSIRILGERLLNEKTWLIRVNYEKNSAIQEHPNILNVETGALKFLKEIEKLL